MSDLSSDQIKRFQKTILDWYNDHQRDLPWRKTRDPYHILISEIMLQQTQVARVIPKFVAWLQQFPTVTELAHASTSEILALWSGLGYNRRALNLKKQDRLLQKTMTAYSPTRKKNFYPFQA